MASRKPSISRATKKPAAKKARGTTVIPEALMTRIDKLEHKLERDSDADASFDAILLERIKSLEATPPAAPALVLDGLVADQLKSVTSSMTSIAESMAKVVERMAELLARAPEEKAPRKAREPKAAHVTQPAGEGVAIKTGTADQGTPVPEEKELPKKPTDVPAEIEKRKADRKTCEHAKTEPVPGNAKLIRCLSCNATLDAPAPAEKVPTFEELREVAVRHAQKRSKQSMLEILAPFAGMKKEEWQGVKLSLVPDAKRAEAMKALEVA